MSETRTEIIDRLINQFDGEWQSGRDVMYIGEGHEYLTKTEFYKRASQVQECNEIANLYCIIDNYRTEGLELIARAILAAGYRKCDKDKS